MGEYALFNRTSHYADIVVVLTWKDFKIRYRNSVLGFLWSLLNPLAYMVILTLVFSFLLRVSIPNFAAWILIGLLVWRFFSIGTSQSLFSIIGNVSLVNKVYVPRYMIVLSNNLANFLGSLLEFLVLFPLLLILGIRSTALAITIPLFLVLEFVLVFGLSLSLSSINVKYRDFYQLWDIALQLGFFLSPIVYDANLIPERFRPVYWLNPVTQLIESVRLVLLQQTLPLLSVIMTTVVSVFFLLGIGWLIFRILEGRFAEEL